MILTNKAKEDFEVWFCKKYESVYSMHNDWDGHLTIFEELPLSMIYGVLVEWFDEIGFYVEINRITFGTKGFQPYFTKGELTKKFMIEDTREGAVLKLIENIDKVYNESLE